MGDAECRFAAADTVRVFLGAAAAPFPRIVFTIKLWTGIHQTFETTLLGLPKYFRSRAGLQQGLFSYFYGFLCLGN